MRPKVTGRRKLSALVSKHGLTKRKSEALPKSKSDDITSQSSPVVIGRQLNLSALDHCNDFMLKFGSLLTILGHLFDGNISDIPSKECRRLDSLVPLIARESSDRQKHSYNFLLKNVPRSARPIDVATNFLYSCGFNYKIADAKRLSSVAKIHPF